MNRFENFGAFVCLAVLPGLPLASPHSISVCHTAFTIVVQVWQQVSRLTVLAFTPLQFLQRIHNPRVEFSKIVLKSKTHAKIVFIKITLLHLQRRPSLLLSTFELTKPLSKSRTQLCPFKAFVSFSISLYDKSSCFMQLIGA